MPKPYKRQIYFYVLTLSGPGFSRVPVPGGGGGGRKVLAPYNSKTIHAIELNLVG